MHSGQKVLFHTTYTVLSEDSPEYYECYGIGQAQQDAVWRGQKDNPYNPDLHYPYTPHLGGSAFIKGTRDNMYAHQVENMPSGAWVTGDKPPHLNTLTLYCRATGITIIEPEQIYYRMTKRVW